MSSCNCRTGDSRLETLDASKSSKASEEQSGPWPAHAWLPTRATQPPSHRPDSRRMDSNKLTHFVSSVFARLGPPAGQESRSLPDDSNRLELTWSGGTIGATVASMMYPRTCYGTSFDGDLARASERLRVVQHPFALVHDLSRCEDLSHLRIGDVVRDATAVAATGQVTRVALVLPECSAMLRGTIRIGLRFSPVQPSMCFRADEREKAMAWASEPSSAATASGAPTII